MRISLTGGTDRFQNNCREEKMKSKIESMILDRSFDYLQPYFYNNPHSLRCRLGFGKTRGAFRKAARERAGMIHDILFPGKADAIIFSQWICDWSDSGDAERLAYGSGADREIARRIGSETRALRFLFENLMNYRHVSVRGLKTYDPDDPGVRRNRIVCYSDGAGFDDPGLIERQLADRDSSEIGLVSFANECILSVYDDRGCDIVFSTHSKMCEFYDRLEPFFLDYDREEMEKRFSLPE